MYWVAGFVQSKPSEHILVFTINFHAHCHNPFSANPTKSSNKLKQFVGSLPTNFLSVFDDFVGLAPKGLIHYHTC